MIGRTIVAIRRSPTETEIHFVGTFGFFSPMSPLCRVDLKNPSEGDKEKIAKASKQLLEAAKSWSAPDKVVDDAEVAKIKAATSANKGEAGYHELASDAFLLIDATEVTQSTS